MSLEEFKSLRFRDTDFMVGNFGTIYRNGRLAQQSLTYDGYYAVGTRRSPVKAHRLVAMCFVEGRTPERNEVNHKDFNRLNNVATNLEWVTHAENVRYSREHGRYPHSFGESNANYGNHKLSQFYAEHPEYALMWQSRPGKQNGRAKPVEVYKDNELIGRFDYLGECFDYMNKVYGWKSTPDTFRYGIRRAHKFGKPYKGFEFKYIA